MKLLHLSAMELLPEDLLENVLRRVSVFDMVRVGCACKTLRARVPNLASSSRPTILLLLHYQHPESPLPPAWAYDADRDAWLFISLDFLHQPSLHNPVASDGGLISFGSGRDFLVCNPITKSCRRLPPWADIPFDDDTVQAFGLNYIPASGTYKFLLLNHSLKRCVSTVMAFDSSSSQWIGYPPHVMPWHFKLHSHTIICCNSRFYSLWYKPGVIVVFALFDGSWMELALPEFEISLRLMQAFLVDVSGSLHLVAGFGSLWNFDKCWEQPTDIRIWKLLVQDAAWEEVTRLPSTVFHDGKELSLYFEHLIRCWGKNGIICMKGLSSEVLMFDIGTNEWKWVKKLVVDVARSEALSLIFEPSMSAMA